MFAKWAEMIGEKSNQTVLCAPAPVASRSVLPFPASVINRAHVLVIWNSKMDGEMGCLVIDRIRHISRIVSIKPYHQ